jgi:Ca2+-binding EF-hand superfamily protein
MPTKTRFSPLAWAAALSLLGAAVAAADNPSAPPPDTTDPPGTALYMGQLRELFAAWDLNGDKFLDKEELAKAFRGPDAKPYDHKKDSPAKDKDASDSDKDPPAKKPDCTQYPDYNFLVALDQDGDGMISRAEFMSWAREYAGQLKQQADQEAKLEALEQKLLTHKAGSNAYKKVEAELKQERAAYNKLQGEAKAEMKAVEKLMKQRLPKK